MSAFGNPQTQLAFSMVENRGVYALLLGSGLSRTAEIPTGWEITLDLVRRMAAASGVENQDDWAAWYRENEGGEPDYSKLLEVVAPSASERQSILRSYIEPDDDERTEGKKLPTPAHHAIAELVQGGFIKVIVTTNFDKLTENALRDVGIEPTVIHSLDSLSGAQPLVHSRCYIVKLHGDYMDARILNTEAELAGYPLEYNVLLDRILDDFGLVVCGWSGDWDEALRAAITRAPNRRYPLYWATRDELKGKAKELCDLRKGSQLQISGADEFFNDLVEQVEATERSQKQNPIGVAQKVDRAKRYVAQSEHRINLAELLGSEVDHIVGLMGSEGMSLRGNYTAEEFSRRVAVFESASEGLCKICGVIGRWGSAQDTQLVVDAAMALHKAGTSVENGLVAYSRLRVYPAALLFQAYTLGLVRAQKWEELHGFFATELVSERGSADNILTALFPIYWQGHMRDNWKDIEGLENLINPMTEKLFRLFGTWSSAFCAPQNDFEKAFILTEFIPALMFLNGIEKDDLAAKVSEGSGRSGDSFFMPVGRTGRGFGFDDGEFNWMSAGRLRDGLVKAGFCNGDGEYYDLALKNYALAARRSRWG